MTFPAVEAPRPARPRRQRHPRQLRQDIQGLRALAVVSVICDHAINWPNGGFVGVDIFFVISGFLITGLLVREHNRTGSISFKGFYLRRARRIIPAATVVLLATVTLTYLLYSAAEGNATLRDALLAATFVANWNYAVAGTDYFRASGPTSPLQHYWSLSVEEQFYLVWPALIVLVLLLWFRVWRNRSASGSALILCFSLVALASFGWALWESANNPTWAYFSTLSRAWELAIGGLVAVVAPMFPLARSQARAALKWAGLVAIALSLLLIHDSTPFPAPYGLLPVMGTAAVIFAGTGHEATRVDVLTNPLTGWVGKVSYSLYLWHFPVLILLGTLLPRDVPFVLIAASSIVLLSMATYYFVEEPIAGWSAAERPARRTRSAKPLRRRLLGAVSALAVLSLACVWQQAASRSDAASAQGAISVGGAASPQEGTGAGPRGEVTSTERERTGQLASALKRSSWPTLEPAVGSGSFKPVSAWFKDHCLNVSPKNVTHCEYGAPTAPKLAVLMGDSVALSYLPGIVRALGNGWTVQVLTMEQCPVSDVDVVAGTQRGNVSYASCRSHRRWSVNWVASHRPSLVIASDSIATAERIVGQNDPSSALAAYDKGLERALRQLAHSGSSRVVLLGAAPLSKPLLTCKTNLSTPASCVTYLRADYLQFVAAQRAQVLRVASARVSFTSVTPWFCLGSACPAFIGNTPQFADGQHLLDTSSRRLAPLLREVFTQALKAKSG